MLKSVSDKSGTTMGRLANTFLREGCNRWRYESYAGHNGHELDLRAEVDELKDRLAVLERRLDPKP